MKNEIKKHRVKKEKQINSNACQNRKTREMQDDLQTYLMDIIHSFQQFPSSGQNKN